MAETPEKKELTLGQRAYRVRQEMLDERGFMRPGGNQIAVIINAIREAEERGRVQEREACADAVGFSNSASAAIRARSTASPTTKESG